MQIENQYGDVLEIKSGAFTISTYIEEVRIRGKWIDRKILGISSDNYFDLPLNSRRLTEITREVSKQEAVQWYLQHEFPRELMA